MKRAFSIGAMAILSWTTACADEASTPALSRQPPQGFIDITILGDMAPGGASGVCYALRVSNGQGVTVHSKQDLCSDSYGNGMWADLTYVVPCDAEYADNTLALWVHPLGATASYDTPCPAPTTGSIDDWTGGCMQTVTCLEYQDIAVEFDLETEAR